MMALRLPEDALRLSSTQAGSRLSVSGSISAKTGLAPARMIELAVAKKLNGVGMTASPPLIPAAASPSQSASVQEAQETDSASPHREANSRSKAGISSPRMERCESQTRSIAAR